VVSRPRGLFATRERRKILLVAALNQIVESAVQNGVGRERVAFRAQAEAVER
jgi:hypothetical protein